jgi:Patatin-like phospholipase
MSVKTGTKAVDELRCRLSAEASSIAKRTAWTTIREKHPFVRDAPPAGFSVASPTNGDVWGASEQVSPLRDPSSYELDGLIDRLNLAAADGLDIQDLHERQAYCDRSIDITMRGGTTSGVVYPTAVCELARRYRLRNIGGASAGAIAAAAAAAAETGRSRGGHGGAPDLSVEHCRQGHVRAGYAGLADCIAWLAQIDDDGPDEFRVGQLFRPTQRARAVSLSAGQSLRRSSWSESVSVPLSNGW